MPPLKILYEQARQLGAESGHSAATWYYDRCDQLTREDYLKVLTGIRDCDPEIMDTMMSGSLSGEMADSMTPQKLFELLEIPEHIAIVVGDEVCEAYEQGFDSAYQNSVESDTMERLRATYVFHIELELIEQDPKKVMSEMLDVALGKMNASLVEESIAEDGEVVV